MSNVWGIEGFRGRGGIRYIMDSAESMRAGIEKRGAYGKVMGMFFLQPSTRTKKGFELAAKKLGMDVIDLSPQGSAMEKGESISDTLRTLSYMCDVLVVRGLEYYVVAEACGNRCAFINAGSEQGHPTQALADWFTIDRYVERPVIFGLRGKNDRALMSLSSVVEATRGSIVLDDYIPEDLSGFNVIYMTRQDIDLTEMYGVSSAARKSKILNLGKVDKDAIILHPLPRTGELPYDVDKDKRAKYWETVENSVWVRMAVILWALHG